MHESPLCFHHLEWPADGARLAGPVVWLRGWIVAQPGHATLDVRVRHAGGTHRGILGLPRADLAAHFKAERSWLPGEFILGVPVGDGAVTLPLEVMDQHGAWHELRRVNLTIAADGAPPPRVEGRLETRPDGTWTVRDAHHPFHGHLDLPGVAPVRRHGRIPVFGWLLDETRPLAAVLATTDALVFNHLDHSLVDETLAEKVPHLARARTARLRGEVDFPATVPEPACLRVYALAPDGSAHLCFAQRVAPAVVATVVSTGSAPLAALPARTLPALPSGRPRRLLFALHGLWPNDATLRALDLVRHLVGSHRWAVRVVSTEDGPLRHEFMRADVESLIVNPAPFFAAADAAAGGQALARLERQIRWDHLDAVVAFNAECGWVLELARRRGIPTLFDCSDDEPMQPDPTAVEATRRLMLTAWRSATSVCFASVAAARAQQSVLAGVPATVVPPWHTPDLPPGAPPAAPRVALAPLRTADWLARFHPDVAARWRFRQGPAPSNRAEQRALPDDRLNGRIERVADWSVGGAALVLGPLFGRSPLRPLLDAAAAGVPLVAADTPTTREILGPWRVPFVTEDNPLALAHAVIAASETAAPSPELAARAAGIRAAHAPAELLPRWEALLASVVATRPNQSRELIPLAAVASVARGAQRSTA
jgi:hypothetical protein